MTSAINFTKNNKIVDLNQGGGGKIFIFDVLFVSPHVMETFIFYKDFFQNVFVIFIYCFADGS